MKAKPFSQACQNNREPILSVLRRVFANSLSVLEIGSGTGQHAVYFSEHCPHLQWHTSDLVENHQGIQQWLDASHLDNVHPPVILDVEQAAWPDINVDTIFSSNTAHIMSWPMVEKLFEHIKTGLPLGGVFALYGPFNYRGEFTSDSNRQFDQWLKTQAPHRAIRDFEAVNQLAEQAGLQLQEDNEMPANNRLLIWQKQ